MNLSNSIMTVLILAIFSVMVIVAGAYPPGARFWPFVIGIPAIALCLLQLLLDARERRAAVGAADGRSDFEKAEEKISQMVGRKLHFDVGHELLTGAGEAKLSDQEVLRRELTNWGFFAALIAGIVLFGFHLAVAAFLIIFLRFRAQASWRLTLFMTAIACAVAFIAFERVLRVSLHSGFVTDYLLDVLDLKNSWIATVLGG